MYVGAGLSYGTDLYEDEVDDALATGFEVNIDDTFGANARIGARVLPILAFELQYEWLDTYDIEIANAGGQSRVDVQTLTANVKLLLPIMRVHPYLLAGIGYQRYELDNNYFTGSVQFKNDEYALAGRVGLGFDLYLTESLVWYAEGTAVLSDADVRIPAAGQIDNLFYAGFQTGLLWRF